MLMLFWCWYCVSGSSSWVCLLVLLLMIVCCLWLCRCMCGVCLVVIVLIWVVLVELFGVFVLLYWLMCSGRWVIFCILCFVIMCSMLVLC